VNAMGSGSESVMLARYERLAIEWDDAQGNSKKANPIFVELHSLAKVLRQSEVGRNGLEALLEHSNRSVRINAASQCLAWKSEKAIGVLEGLVSPRGRHSLSAQMTLMEFRAGRLNLDW
jgi:hypothetical protein